MNSINTNRNIDSRKWTLLNDYVFKRIFTKDIESGILKDLLEGILEEKITKIELLNSEIPKEALDEKASILDIRAEIDENKIVDIEMQVANEYNLADRGPLYMCKNISTQMKTGEDYTKIKPSIAIWILNFNYYKRNSYHSIARMKFEKTKEKEYVEMGYKKEDEIATEDLEMHFIELPKFIKKNPGVDRKLEQWLWVISGKEEKIKMIAEKNPKVKRALTLLDQVSNDPKEQERFENRLISEYLYKSSMHGAKEAGIEEGKIKEKIEIAKEMLNKNMDIKLISQITKLSIEKIKSLKD